MRYSKALHQFDRYLTPTWGEFELLSEVADDLFVNRDVRLYSNGHALRYDRQHYADEFGSLGEARRTVQYENRCAARWQTVGISAAEFEAAWETAGHAKNQPQRYQEQRLELPPEFAANDIDLTRIPPWLRAGLSEGA